MQVYAQDMIKEGKWPKEFKDVVPQRVRDVVEEEYGRWDKGLYPEVQVDMGRKMLKLRVTFEENAKIAKAYRVDFKLMDLNVNIIILVMLSVESDYVEGQGVAESEDQGVDGDIRGETQVLVEKDEGHGVGGGRRGQVEEDERKGTVGIPLQHRQAKERATERTMVRLHFTMTR